VDTKQDSSKFVKNPAFTKYLNIYEFETTLPGSGQVVKFKPLTTGQLKKLLVYENEKSIIVQEEAMDQLITSCVISEDFDIDELYLQDRFFLLIEIRKKTKGEQYEFTFKCPKCNSQSINSLDLNDLEVKKIPEEFDNSVSLTDDISVTLRHIKRKDFKLISQFLDIEDRTETQINSGIQTGLFAAGIEAIATPDGIEENTDIQSRIYLVDNTPTSGFEKIKNWYDDNDFGINMVVKTSCKNDKCDYTEETDIPMGNFFL